MNASTHVCIHTSACIFACVLVYICIYARTICTYVSVKTHVWLPIHTSINIDVHTSVCMCTCVLSFIHLSKMLAYVSMWLRIYAFTHLCGYMHTYTHVHMHTNV